MRRYCSRCAGFLAPPEQRRATALNRRQGEHATLVYSRSASEGAGGLIDSQIVRSSSSLWTREQRCKRVYSQRPEGVAEGRRRSVDRAGTERLCEDG
jgi:hypothetical protein